MIKSIQCYQLADRNVTFKHDSVCGDSFENDGLIPHGLNIWKYVLFYTQIRYTFTNTELFNREIGQISMSIGNNGEIRVI